ncbi:Alpha/Beta hydrolase protein [Mycena olivaceomarginata]|nr:Alpha/Beta hydrolase protein [Mycena olivaceomarginata]
MLSSSSSSSSFTDAWLPGPYGTNFYTRTFHAAKPCAVLVFVHGAAEHCGRYHALHTQLAAEHDIAVFAFDLRGFGQTALHPTQRSATSAYGKTDWDKQLDDVEWALRRTGDEFPGLPVFLMGASMRIVLGLLCDVERAKTPVISSLAGVIASAPCITPTTPPPRPVYWLGRIVPYALAPARVKPQELSRNTETNSAYVADPFVIAPGSWRCRLDMLSAGKRILEEGYAHWPEDTPVLFLHGDADPVNSVEGTNTLYGRIAAQDKKLITYSGAYHELHNEPDGVKEKYLLDVVDFVRAHLQCV